jgi:hypothetical protein
MQRMHLVQMAGETDRVMPVSSVCEEVMDLNRTFHLVK